MGNLKDLRPVWDPEAQVIRVTGRIGPIFHEDNRKPPILLPKSHHAVVKWIEWMHERRGHAGVKNTHLFIRNNYWIIAGREAIKSVIKRCVSCQRINARPYEIVGIDIAGPLLYYDEKDLKRADRRKKGKRHAEEPKTSEDEESGSGSNHDSDESESAKADDSRRRKKTRKETSKPAGDKVYVVVQGTT